jgi:glycine hydroxymethyltransferase
MGKDFENTMGITTPKDKNDVFFWLSSFPGNQGGPLMHIIAAKAVALEKLLQMSFVLMHTITKKMPMR